MSSRHVAAITGAAVSVVVAAGLASIINVGILRAAGPPSGPGRLGGVDPVASMNGGEAELAPGAGSPSGLSAELSSERSSERSPQAPTGGQSPPASVQPGTAGGGVSPADDRRAPQGAEHGYGTNADD